FGGNALRRGASKLRAVEVELIGQVRHVVIGLRDRGRRKRVGGDDVGARAQIIGVDILDRLLLGEDQQVIVAADVAVKIPKALATEGSLVICEGLDHGAHGAVEHQNAFAGGRQQKSSL